MRYIFLLLALVGLISTAFAPAQAQTGGATTTHGVINWGGYANVIGANNRTRLVPSFEGAFHAWNEQVGVFNLRLSGNVGEGQLTNAVYEAFSAKDAKLLDISKLPGDAVFYLRQGTEMKLPVSHLSLRPVRRNAQTGQPERLVSFDFVYSPTSLAARGGPQARDHARASVLNTGDWFKIGVAESGIYKLDYNTLRSLGMNLQGVNPSRIRFYGNSTGILPQLNSAYRPDDLAENAVMFVGNSDAAFDTNEYLLFYSPGAHTWQDSSGTQQHRNNIYCDTTYYFITASGTAAGKRVATVALPAATATADITTFTDRYFYEHDLANLLYSGRQWVGDGFSNGTTKDIVVGSGADFVAGTPIKVRSVFVATSEFSSSFQLTLNGQVLGNQAMIATPKCDYCTIATPTLKTHRLTAPTNLGTDLRIGITYNSGGTAASAYLDYLEITLQRQLQLHDSPLEFRSYEHIGPQSVSRFVLNSAPADAIVWEVTNPRNAQAQTVNAGTFTALTDSLREYIAFQPGSTFKSPVTIGRVANQNLHALNNDGTLDFVIVTYPAFKAQAERLADHRRTHNNLQVAVVTTNEIYNEFSSGGQDVTAIRDLMKQVYDRAPAGKHLSLLLFGDASFDYKSDPSNNKSWEPTWWSQRVPFKNSADFDRINQNYVPTYESRESFTPFYGTNNNTASYSSDDYFGFLDDSEGEWVERNGIYNDLLDVGVGRLPVRAPEGSPNSAAHAEEMVTKVISYDAQASYGKWRNRVTLTADDGNGGIFALDSILGSPWLGSDRIAERIQLAHPAYNIRKVYLDMYPQVNIPAGERSPECNQAIDNAFEQGSLVVNYLGHGGPKGLADEQLVTNASVLALQNANNLAFVVTGTCDFSTYDNPDATSAGEQLLTDNPRGGAIGLFTTTRVVDASKNAGLNGAFYNRLFQRINGQHPNIATITMLSKNDYPEGSINNRNYTLLADPSMVLAYPEETVTLDRISRRQQTGSAVTWVKTDTLEALSQIRLEGRVLTASGALNTTFNGTAQITIFDKPTIVMTLGNEVGKPYSGPDDAPKPIKIQENVIYGGQATVVNGNYTVTFVVPKDINYNTGLGKVSLYAFDGNRIDAQGYKQTAVGGSNSSNATDNTPPRISLFMDTKSFVFGGTTAQNTTLLGDLSDENGINTTGAGIGHEITATLDNDPNKLVVLNDTYVAKVDSFTTGQVQYLFKSLAAGPHILRVKAWDTYNNSSEKEVEFVVANNEKLAINHVLNYPNPFAGTTTFLFDHNRAGDDLDIQVQIFTVSGKLVRTLRTTMPNSESHQNSLTWNGRDEYEDQLARGVYVYRINVRSPRDGATATKFEKLVILN